MSVISADRGISSKQFYETAMEVVKKVADLSLRQFSIHNEDKWLPNFNRDYMEKYEILANESGLALRNMARSMIVHISKAYSITDVRKTNRASLKDNHQTSAIGDCEAMATELNLVPAMLHISPFVVNDLFILILYEKDLLTNWRKEHHNK
jgi:hypothetical protein